VAFSSALQADRYNLHRLAARAVESNHLDEAHATLQSIRGIGPKIASLFLRDVALDRNLPVAHLRDRELLQPVDVWIRRTTERLTQKSFENDKEVAGQFVQLANHAGCCALSLNAGGWYFGSQIARTVQNLNDALESPESVRHSIDKHAKRLQDESQRLGDVLRL